MLRLENVTVAYGKHQALHRVSLEVAPGRTTVILGANGAGKTTLLNTIAGLVRPQPGGHILFEGRSIEAEPTHRMVAAGIALVPEGRRLFPKLTVEENLLLGAYRREARTGIARNLAFCFEAFPVLHGRRRQLAGSMSGGEQQMLAIGRALMSAPRILLVDEPSVGLAPILVSRVISKIKELKERYQLTVLMAEQNFNQATKIADRGYIIVHGKIEFEGRNTRELRENELVKKYYLGV